MKLDFFKWQNLDSLKCFNMNDHDFAQFLPDSLRPFSIPFWILLHLIQLNIFHGRIVQEIKIIAQRVDIKATANEVRQYYSEAGNINDASVEHKEPF